MAGYIDEAQHAAVGCRHIGEAEIDADAARLSSLSRSVSTPVSARTRAVLP